MNRHTLKPVLFAVLVAAPLQSCALLLPDLLHLGGDRAPPDAEIPSTDSDASAAWRTALAVKAQAFDALNQRLDDAPRADALAPDQRAAAALTLLDNDVLAGVAADCAAGLFKGEALEVSPSLKASVLCPRIEARAALLRARARGWGGEIIERVLREEQAVTDAIARDRVLPVRLLEERPNESLRNLMDRLRARARPTFDRLREPIPADALAKAKGVTDRRALLLQKLSQEGALQPAVGVDVRAQRAIVDAASDRFEVRRVLMRDAVWRTVKNDFGLLRSRFKNAAVLVKARDATFCAVVPVAVSQDYEGRGRFSRMHRVDTFLFAAPVPCP